MHDTVSSTGLGSFGVIHWLQFFSVRLPRRRLLFDSRLDPKAWRADMATNQFAVCQSAVFAAFVFAHLAAAYSAMSIVVHSRITASSIKGMERTCSASNGCFHVLPFGGESVRPSRAMGELSTQLKPVIHSRISCGVLRCPAISSCIPSGHVSRTWCCVSGCLPRSLVRLARACSRSPASTYSSARSFTPRPAEGRP